ncbi:MAG: hypothetical protein IT306_16305 [Chloroflexi bacterium]|nr:hypothetical protein [Chloroflexota bacterium]
MGTAVLKALELLRQLQALDSQIDDGRDRVATIDATLQDRSEFEAAKQRHQSAALPVKSLDAEQKDLELKLGTARAQLAENEQKLYGGKIANPKELTDLQNRGTDLRRQISVGETAELQVIEKLDAARNELNEAEAALRTIVAERRTLEASLIAERKDLVASVRATTASRDQLRTQIEAQPLRTYDRLRVRHGGFAVAEVKQRTCQGCRVSMIAAQEQRLRQGEQLVTCQSCGRFLYLLN